MAARIAKRLVGPSQLAGSNATLYTAPNPSSLPTGMTFRTKITAIHLSNPDSVQHTITLAIGAGATAANRIYDGYVLSAGATKDDYSPHWINANEVFDGSCDTGSKVVIVVDGEEIIFGG